MNTILGRKVKNNFENFFFFQVNESCSFWKNYGECKKM